MISATSAIAKSRNLNYIFLYRHRILELPLTIDKFLKASDHQIRNLQLRFTFSCKNHRLTGLIHHYWHRAIVKRVDTNSISRTCHARTTWPGREHVARSNLMCLVT